VIGEEGYWVAALEVVGRGDKSVPVVTTSGVVVTILGPVTRLRHTGPALGLFRLLYILQDSCILIPVKLRTCHQDVTTDQIWVF
jgi:hypothetical protein